MHSFRDRLFHARARLRQIAAHGSAGLGIRDKFKLAVVGYARGHTFDAPGLISQAARKLFPVIAVRPSSFGGLVLQVDPSDLSQLVVIEEILIENVYDLSLVPFTPDFVLDCGAHCGMFALLAASAFPHSKLVCFEPDPANYEWVRKQIRANSLQADLQCVAVSTEDGEALFEADRGCAGALVEEPVETRATITVTTLDLGSYIRKLKSMRLLLKLDVEGAEEKLLPVIADVLPQNCVVFLETHRGEDSWRRLSNLLTQHGFTVSQTRRRDIYTDGVAIRTSTCNSA
jgi:FkbM family methyltransferase